MCKAPNSILSRFTVVLLDMNGTFMFGGDRFGPEQDFAATYHALGGRHHRLGVIANIISRKEPWLSEFARAGVLHLFATTVFSSDSRSVKPSRKLFEHALSAIHVPRSEVVFVGDSLRCDIGGAAGAGLASIWIDRAGRGRGARDPEPTCVIGNLLELINS